MRQAQLKSIHIQATPCAFSVFAKRADGSQVELAYINRGKDAEEVAQQQASHFAKTLGVYANLVVDRSPTACSVCGREEDVSQWCRLGPANRYPVAKSFWAKLKENLGFKARPATRF